MQLIDDVLRKRYTELQQQGRSEAEIEKIFSDIDYGAAMIEAQSPVFPRLKRSRCRSSQEVNDSPTPFSALNYC